jgi:hypothetical protein
MERDPTYGFLESNPITDEIRTIRDEISETVEFNDPRLNRIVRLRLVSDPGFPVWDLSYCYGVLTNGDYVRVELPWYQFSKRNLQRDLITMCKESGVYGKGLGLFDHGVISKLS